MKEKNGFAVKLIRTYQKNKQIVGTGHCKFYPTCSEYAAQTYKKFNFFYASLLVIWRILRCNHFTIRKYDPVKLTKKEKQDLKFINSLKESFNNDFIDYIINVDKECNSGEELYKYIYDYCEIPLHPASLEKENAIYASRFITSNQEYPITSKTIYEVDKYLNLTNILAEQGFISKKPIKTDLEFNDNLYLIPLESLSIEQMLTLANINDGIIIVNNCEKDIDYLDFEVKPFNGNLKEFKKKYKTRDKLILKTSNLDIMPYLEYLSYSINCYTKYSEVNYFYHVNKNTN